MIFQSIIEIIITMLFIIGIFNENKIAALEKRIFEKIKKCFGGDSLK